MITDLPVTIFNKVNQTSITIQCSSCYTVGSLIMQYSKMINISPGFLQAYYPGTITPLNRRTLLRNVRLPMPAIMVRIDIDYVQVPENIHLRTTLPIEFITKRRYDTIFLEDMINFNSEASYRFLSITLITLPCYKPYNALTRAPERKTLEEYFNLDKIYYMIYNIEVFILYLNTMQKQDFALTLSESQFFSYILDTLYDHFQEMEKQNHTLNPIFKELIESFTKVLKQYPLRFTEEELNHIVKMSLKIAAMESVDFQSRQLLLQTITTLISKSKIPFPTDFYDTFVSLIMNQSMKLRQESLKTFEPFVFPANVFVELLMDYRESCSSEFLKLMASHFTNFKPFAEEVVGILLSCIENTKSYQRKFFMDVLKTCLNFENVSEDLRRKIQHFFIKKYLNFDLSDDDKPSFNIATDILLNVANTTTPVKGKNNEIVMKNKLYRKLISFHTNREPLPEFDIDGDKFLQTNGRTGLKKYGQTCYLNSTLQMWFSLPPIRKLFINTNSNDKMFSKLHELFTNMMYTNRKSTSTKSFVDNCVMFENVPFNPNEQQDAAEFMVSALDKCSNLEEFKEIKNLVQWSIEHVTQGINGAEYQSSIKDDFFLFSLELSQNLEKSFKNFMQPNYFTKNNQYNAQELGKKIDAKRFSIIKHCPPIMFISLNRFRYQIEKRMREKLTQECNIPLELDMSQYTSESEQGNSKIYKLRAAIVHKGTATGGHYICYVKKEGRNKLWLKCDESEVTVEKEEDFLNPACGKTQEATGYIFAYSLIDLDEKEQEYQPDDDLLEKIQNENENNVRCSLFCSAGYRNLITQLASSTFPLFHDICLRFCCDTMPYLNRYFVEPKFYQNLRKSLKKSKELSLMFFNYSKIFLRDMLIQTYSETVSTMSGNLLHAVALSHSIPPQEILSTIYELIPGLFDRYYNSEYVFRILRKILLSFPDEGIDFFEEGDHKEILASFITDQFQQYLKENPLMKRVYVLDGIDLTSFLKIISIVEYPNEEYEFFYKQSFFVDMIATRSKPKSIAEFILKFFSAEHYVEYFLKNSNSIKCKSAAGVLFYIVPNDALRCLLMSSYSKEDIADQIIDIAKQRKSQHIIQCLIDNTDHWTVEYLLNSDANLRRKGISIAYILCPTKDMQTLKDEELSEEEEEEEEDQVDDEMTEEEKKNNAAKLVLTLINCVQFAAKALENDYLFKHEKSNDKLQQYLKLIDTLLLSCPRIPKIAKGENEYADKQQISSFYGLEKLEVLCRPIGEFSIFFSINGSLLLSIFATYNVTVPEDAIISILNVAQINNQETGSKFLNYLPQIAHYITKSIQSDSPYYILIQYFIDQVAFNNPIFFSRCRDMISNLTNVLVPTCPQSFITAIEQNFDRCIRNNFILTLDVCYLTHIKKPFLSSLTTAIITNNVSLNDEFIDKLIEVNSDAKIHEDDLNLITSQQRLNFPQSAKDKFLNYCKENIIIIPKAPIRTLSLSFNDKDDQEQNDDENQEEEEEQKEDEKDAKEEEEEQNEEEDKQEKEEERNEEEKNDKEEEQSEEEPNEKEEEEVDNK